MANPHTILEEKNESPSPKKKSKKKSKEMLVGGAEENKEEIDLPNLDTAFIDDAEIENENKQSGGKYMVGYVCHRVTPRDTFTSLGLIRDSFGKGGGF